MEKTTETIFDREAALLKR
jgi:hypothetical protein